MSSSQRQPQSNNTTTSSHQPKRRSAHPWLKRILAIVAIIVWTVGCILLVQLLLALLFRFLIDTFHLSAVLSQTIYTFLTYLISCFLIIFLPPIIFKKTKSSRAELGLLGWPTWTDIGLAPIGFIVYVVIAAIVSGIFTIFPWFNATEAQDLGYSQMLFGTERMLAFFSLIVIVPIAEELIFRGFLYGKLKKILKSSTKQKSHSKKHSDWPIIIIASLITSLAFAIMHGQWNVGVNVFVMSLVLCFMREITGTIYAGIILHMIKNAVAFVFVFIINNGF